MINWNDSAPEGKYPKGMRSVFAEMMKEEGIMALYKGVTPVLLRAFPANAVSIPSAVNHIIQKSKSKYISFIHRLVS